MKKIKKKIRLRHVSDWDAIDHLNLLFSKKAISELQYDHTKDGKVANEYILEVSVKRVKKAKWCRNKV